MILAAVHVFLHYKPHARDILHIRRICVTYDNYLVGDITLE